MIHTVPILLVLSALLAVQQNALPQRTLASVRALPTVAALATASRSVEITIDWLSVDAPGPGRGPVPGGGVLVTPRSLPEVHRFRIVRRVVIDGAPARERDPQVAADELVVVAVNSQGREIGWLHLTDPRVVRGEQPGARGTLTGQVLHRTETQLMIRLPDGLDASALRVYEVLSGSADFTLRNLGTISLR